MSTKLRVWADNRMYYLEQGAPWHIVFNSSYDNRVRISDCMIMYEVTPNEVMEYTGVNNKDNDEIWQGDIGRFTTQFKETETIYLGKIVKQHGGYALVGKKKYFVEGKHIQDGDPNFAMYLPNMYKDIEILGNVYENPEMLEVVQS